MAQEQFDEERLNIIKQNIRNEGISPADIQGKQIASKELLSTGVPTGAGLNPENLFLLEKALNIIKPTQPVQTQSNLIPQTSMPPMYDTSPYRALDIIGAGIGRRPTQEAYFNRLETIQNERLQDEYNRRTDTPEAKNAQELLKKVFGNTLDEDIINKVSVKYLADNYPMIAQIAERQSVRTTGEAKDRLAQEKYSILMQDKLSPEVFSENLKKINASNVDTYLKRDDEAIKAKTNEETLVSFRNAYLNIDPNAKQGEIDTITPQNFDQRVKEFNRKNAIVAENEAKKAEEERKKALDDPKSQESLNKQNDLNLVYGKIPGAIKIISTVTPNNYRDKINLLDNLAKKNEVIVTKATGQTPNQLKESIDKVDQVTLRKMVEKESKAIEFINQLDDLKNYINSNGISYNDQQLASKYGNIVALYKDTKELGALDNGVENLVNKVLKDPTSFTSFTRNLLGSDFQKDYIKTIDNIRQSSLDSFKTTAKISGYQPKMILELEKKKEANLKDGTYQDDDGRYFKVINGKKVYL